MNFNSCHDFSQKVGLVKTLLLRANSKLIINHRDKAKEVLFICNVLRDNDYPDRLLNTIKKEIKHKIYKNNHICKEKCDYVRLPYFEGFTNLVSRILQKFDSGFILTLIKQSEFFTSAKGFCRFDI